MLAWCGAKHLWKMLKIRAKRREEAGERNREGMVLRMMAMDAIERVDNTFCGLTGATVASKRQTCTKSVSQDGLKGGGELGPGHTQGRKIQSAGRSGLGHVIGCIGLIASLETGGKWCVTARKKPVETSAKNPRRTQVQAELLTPSTGTFSTLKTTPCSFQLCM